MSGIDLVLVIGTDQHEVLKIRAGQQILEQIERRRIQPLQIVEEQRQGLLWLRENLDEAPEHQLETPLRGLRRKLGDRRLVADDELQLGDKVDHQPAVRAQRLHKEATPSTQLDVARAEKRPNETLKCLCERRIRDVALVLVEFARSEKPTRRNEQLMKFIDDRRLADAGISRDKHQLWCPALHDAIEEGEQRLDLARPSVKLLWNQQPVRYVVSSEREAVDARRPCPTRETAAQVALETRGGLVALLGSFGE